MWKVPTFSFKLKKGEEEVPDVTNQNGSLRASLMVKSLAVKRGHVVAVGSLQMRLYSVSPAVYVPYRWTLFGTGSEMAYKFMKRRSFISCLPMTFPLHLPHSFRLWDGVVIGMQSVKGENMEMIHSSSWTEAYEKLWRHLQRPGGQRHVPESCRVRRWPVALLVVGGFALTSNFWYFTG